MTPHLFALVFALAPAAGTRARRCVRQTGGDQKEVKEAESVFFKAAEALPDTPEGEKKQQELYKAFDKKRSDGFLAAVELAKADPKSPTSFDALEWVLTTPRAYFLPVGKSVLRLATEHYAADPRVGKIVAWVGYYLHEGEEASAEAAARSTPCGGRTPTAPPADKL